MNYIEQTLKILFENHINYQEKDFKELNSDDKNLKNNSDFLERNKISNISIITGSNGIGKTFFLESLKEELRKKGKSSLFLSLKKINSLDELKKQLNPSVEYLILDGLDELNTNIFQEIKDYLFSLNNAKLIISSRKDFLQKSSMFNIHYNIYELMPFADYTVQEILKKNSIDKKTVTDIYSLIKIPRFMNYILEIKNEIKDLHSINKYNLLDILVNKHLDILNNRSSICIEKHIHKKILQSMALIMMMLGKMNITLDEFTVFLSKIDSLDIKTYILNKDIFETFSSNQILLNDGSTISFECKEFLEFLAAKEIIENNLSNSDLYSLVFDNKNNCINSLWFNTLSYIITESSTYKKLILDYITINLEKQDSLLDLLLNLTLSQQDLGFILHILNTIIKQYTKLYQYIDIHNKSQAIFDILSINYNLILDELVSIIEKLSINDNLDNFNTIYINNLLSCIENIIDSSKKKDLSLKHLKLFLGGNLDIFFNNTNINVRFLIIYLQIFTPNKIDSLIKRHSISTRQLSLILYYCTSKNKLKEIDSVINNYIFNSKNKFRNNEFIISNLTIQKFIMDNYNLDRINNLLSSIDTDDKISGFIHFLNDINSVEIFSNFDNKSSANILYQNIIKPFIDIDIKNKHLREEIFWERNHDYFCFENILKICIKHNIISLDTIGLNKNNYMSEIIYELVIKILLNNNLPFEQLYNQSKNKYSIFKVWRLDLNQETQNYYRENIKEYFYTEYQNYLIQNFKNSDNTYIRLEQKLEKIETDTTNNIYYKIDDLYSIIKDSKYLNIINSDIIITNRIKNIIKTILIYIDKIDISKLTIKYTTENSYNLSYDFEFYPKAIFILYKMKYNIQKYNLTNIVLFSEYTYEIPLKYSSNDYNFYLKYLKNNASNSYIRHFLNHIINTLRPKYSKKLFNLLLSWIDSINFSEYEVTLILEFIYEHKEYLLPTNIKKIKKFKTNKICQDLFISLGIESFIYDRVEYIMDNLAIEGDVMEIDASICSEYHSEYYTKELFNIGIQHRKYIIKLLEFAFKKYNSGDYYYFLKYILNLAYNYIKNNIQYPEINNIIDKILELERQSKNRYFYSICLSIKNLKNKNSTNIYGVISTFNHLINKYNEKIYTYEELFEIIKEILDSNIFEDIQRMKFLEIFKDKKNQQLLLKEETYQFLIGYELKRILDQKGFNAKIIFEATGFDKKRSDILIICDGFIQNIVIETKLANNPDLKERNINTYINNKLENYKKEFESPKLLFVIINQTNCNTFCHTIIDRINSVNNSSITPILINFKEYFNTKNKRN